MRHLVRLRAAGIVGVVLAACSSGSSGGGGGGGNVTAPATAAEYCDAYYASFAQRYAACHHASVAWGEYVLDASRLCADPVKSVAAGRAAYDTAAASACLSFVASAGCTTLDGIFAGTAYEASCGAAIRGTGAASATCFTESDCASSRCDTSTTCPGTCYTGLSTAGTPCQDRRDCAPGHYCARSASLGYLTCLPLSNYPALNQRCSAGVSLCQPGLYCDGAVTPNACAPLKTSGACASSEECAPGYACPSGTCTRVPGPGDACPQVLDACGPGLFCGTGSTCVDEVAIGSTCTQVGPYYAGCVGGYCDVYNGGLCTETNRTGDPCTTDLQCAPGWVCRLGACVAPECAEP